MKNSITFRIMRIQDFEAVTNLWQQSNGIRLRDSDSKTALQKYLHRNPNCSFIATEEQGIVGAILSGHDGRRGYIYHLAVSKTHRKQRIGKKLVELSLKALEKESIFKVLIAVENNNFDGLHFWKNAGWELRKDLLIMQKTADNKPNA